MHLKRLVPHSWEKKLTRAFRGLSLRRDPNFIPNVVLCIGVVFVWRGVWNLIDIYFFPDRDLLSNILAIVIGIAIIYLPDNSFSKLGGIEGKDNDKKRTEKLLDR